MPKLTEIRTERVDMVHYGMLREEWEGRTG